LIYQLRKMIDRISVKGASCLRPVLQSMTISIRILYYHEFAYELGDDILAVGGY